MSRNSRQGPPYPPNGPSSMYRFGQPDRREYNRARQSYRAVPPPESYQPDHGFQIRGTGRPSQQYGPPRQYQQPNQPPRGDHYQPSRSDNYQGARDNSYQPSRGDSYRPYDFSFRVPTANAPSFQQPAFPPTQPRQPARSNDSRRPQDRQRRSRAGVQKNQQFSGRRPPPRATADRPLLRSRRSATPEQFSGMTNDKGEVRFRDAGDLSSISDDSDHESRSGDEPAAKRTKRYSDDAENTVPKWSNPDPYTSLPPVDDSNRKKKDFVKIIRKARVSAGNDSSSKAANNEDFISFEDDNFSTGNVDDDMAEQVEIVDARNDVPLISHDIHPSQTDSTMKAPGTNVIAISVDNLGPPPSGNFDNLQQPPQMPESQQITIAEPIAAAQDMAGSLDTSSNGIQQDRKRKRGGPGSAIVEEWQALQGVNATPWCVWDHSSTADIGVRLHKEICDFYEYVRPQEFENKLRHELVDRVTSFLRENYRQCEVRYFGSFAAGLYLPNADMDLVVLTKHFIDSGRPGLPDQGGQLRKFMFGFKQSLERKGVARPGSGLAIWKAKVPLVKYVDKLTGLRVDISFENDTGPIANRTYQRWKSQYPAMPPIVVLVKQFLMMRDLNEVHTGGIGGFSVTCLVVSLLQHLPQVQSGAMDATQHLGEVLMNFLDFYGNKFNSTTTGIQMEPPKYFPKHLETRVMYNPRKPTALSIIDPNRSSNDISSGSSNVVGIFKAFSDAYRTLQQHLYGVANGDVSRSQSLLGPLFRGNYGTFERQRALLKALHDNVV